MTAGLAGELRLSSVAMLVGKVRPFTDTFILQGFELCDEPGGCGNPREIVAGTVGKAGKDRAGDHAEHLRCCSLLLREVVIVPVSLSVGVSFHSKL